jgi:hypothetical protein
MFFIFTGIIIGLIGAIVAGLLHTFFNIQFWGHWLMDAFSIFILTSGLSWVILHSLFSTPNENSKRLITHSLKSSFYAASIPGIIMAIISIMAAWDHNPSGEYHQNGYINWGDLSFIGGSWFVVITTAVFLIFFCISVATILIKKHLTN